MLSKQRARTGSRGRWERGLQENRGRENMIIGSMIEGKGVMQKEGCCSPHTETCLPAAHFHGTTPEWEQAQQ